jgi:predicted acylesterase/phospholipase RssA
MFGLPLEILRYREQSDIPVLISKIIKRVQSSQIDYTYVLNKDEYNEVDFIVNNLKKRMVPIFELIPNNICVSILKKYIQDIPEESIYNNGNLQLLILNLIRLTNANTKILTTDNLDYDLLAFYSMYPSKYKDYLYQLYLQHSNMDLSPIVLGEDKSFHFPTKLLDLRYPDIIMKTNGITQKPSTGVKILCLDGGGMRGLFEIKILEYICIKLYGSASKQNTNKFINQFDLIAGTSTGCIVTAALIMGYSLTDIRKLFYSMGKDIFKNSYMNLFGNIYGYLRSGDYYNHQVLIDFLDNILGNKQMYELDKKFIIVATANKTNILTPYLFKSYDDLSGPYESCKDITLVDSIRASTAAPTYFAPYFDLNGNRYLDGGLTANNPTEIAIFEAYNLFPRQTIDLILSIGTGKMKPGTPSTSLLGLNDEIINMVANSDATHIRVLEWINDYASSVNYFRFSPDNLGSIRLDTTDQNILENGEIITDRSMRASDEKVTNLCDLLK